MGPIVNPLSEMMGAEILGVDLSESLSDDVFRRIQQAFYEHKVIAIRGQKLSPHAQIDFSRRFGDLEIQGNSEYTVEGAPEVLVLSNDIKNGKPIGVIDGGDFWHSDSSHKTHPSCATILHSLKNPRVGGDTLFADMYLAYDTLPGNLKDRIAGLQGLHAASKLKNKRVVISKDRPGAADFYASRLDRPDVPHPMVRTHSATGRKALYISPRFTIGILDMEDEEAQALLDLLFDHQLKPEFQYRHKWKEGDVVMWDNRCVLHCAGGAYEYPDVRTMHRTVVAGEKPH
jgi:taurine dioxygenase